MIASFSLLTPLELNSLHSDLTLFLFPLGGLEQHGPCLPFGVKLLQAEEFAKALADDLQKKLPQWNFVLMPLLPLSVDSVTNRLAIQVRPHVVRDAVVDQCEHLKRLGYKNFAAVSSHLTPKQQTALEDASRIVSGKGWFSGKKAQLISVGGALIERKQVWESPLIALPREHGGEKDTGFMLRYSPALVQNQYLNLEDQPRPRASITRFFAFMNHEIDGYWGKPKLANPTHAEQDLLVEVSTIAQKMLPWLERGQGKKQFQSAYRYFPFNGSFFKAYVLATIFFIMMLLWALWSLKDVFEP